MSLKKRKTMAKMMREQELKERRQKKQEKREAARIAKLEGHRPPDVTGEDPDQDGAAAPEEREEVVSS